MFDHEAEYARTHDDLPAKVFLSVGANEVLRPITTAAPA
jgi:hypothetical protein